MRSQYRVRGCVLDCVHLFRRNVLLYLCQNIGCFLQRFERRCGDVGTLDGVDLLLQGSHRLFILFERLLVIFLALQCGNRSCHRQIMSTRGHNQPNHISPYCLTYSSGLCQGTSWPLLQLHLFESGDASHAFEACRAGSAG